MRRLAFTQVISMLMIISICYGQSHMVVNLKSPSMTVKKINGSSLVIPLEAVLVNPTAANLTKK